MSTLAGLRGWPKSTHNGRSLRLTLSICLERLFGRLCHDARPVAKKVELHTMRWDSGGLPVAFG
jgi:hypothetical protein